jgi:hypothetical protein
MTKEGRRIERTNLSFHLQFFTAVDGSHALGKSQVKETIEPDMRRLEISSGIPGQHIQFAIDGDFPLH